MANKVVALMSVLTVALMYVPTVNAAAEIFFSEPYRYSCLHYCQSHQYGNALRYCCRAAEVTLASEHLEGLSLPLPQSLPTAPSPTRTISTIHGTRPSAAGRNFDTHTHAANPLFNLLALSLGPSIPTTVITSTATATTVIDLVSQDRGLCPPLRDYCPRGQDAAPHLALCNTDYGLVHLKKCCFDACLEAHVCKTAVGDRPRRDALKEQQQQHHHLKTKGAAAATLVMTADGEPVSVVVNAHGSPVSLHEGLRGDVVATSPVIASSASAPGSRSPRTQTMVQLSEKDVVFIIEDGKGNVVVDDNDNTLTLVQVGTGPTLVFNDEGIEVVLGIVSSDFSLTATVKRTKIPNLNINYKGNEYSNKGYNRVSDQRHSMGDMIMGHGKNLKMEDDPLTVMNSDGVTFMINMPLVSENGFYTIENASVDLVALDKAKVNAMLDKEGNLITDENNIISLTDENYVSLITPSVFEDVFVVDGGGETVTLVDRDNLAIKLRDQLGNEVKPRSGKMKLRLDNSIGASLLKTVDGVHIIDGAGQVVEDQDGYPLRVVSLDEFSGSTLEYQN
nr:LOW QUALITY PROTEIN: uncharacterized protein LOC128691336 [Cherax quadricarinatus]